MESEGDS